MITVGVPTIFLFKKEKSLCTGYIAFELYLAYLYSNKISHIIFILYHIKSISFSKDSTHACNVGGVLLDPLIPAFSKCTMTLLLVKRRQRFQPSPRFREHEPVRV
jgi:hypothetical protein